MPLRFQLSDRGRLLITPLAAAIVVMAAIILAVVFIPAQYTDRIQGRWVRFSVMTAFLIVFSLRTYWKARKSLGFRCIFLSFLALHLFGVGHLWSVHNELLTLEVALVGGVVFAFMALVIYWVLGVGPDVHRRRSRPPWITQL